MTNDWQVIASGEVDIYKDKTTVGNVVIGHEKDTILVEIINEKFEGKNIEIAVRVKEEKCN